MPSAAILKIEKSPEVRAPLARQSAKTKAPAARRGFAAEAIVQRRELAMLLRSIKTLVRQSP